ncbi:ABC transporter permease [Meiothermus granaticius]|uniref:Glutathione transport system permease protein GsiD n=1 Tax=Meiothermus granaticius NBRC 107808 TaxID=1227551 RepID=A0A399FED6_9DEIN|nr:ABC transporter permease [Meiothermus granaticius]MCL6526273.1 ABC transporter permease [Thermaceae bacterium]RIH93452.1 Glutathione transport system permease protein GsiD [Meiothermus granaticius NBRC 107808]GEM87700.1 glutathione ABC transporter permease GsiD [Meiothermus granaticius NBRC 107808]
MVEARTRSKAPVRNPVLRRLFSNRLALVGGVILALLALGAVFAPWLSPYSPTQTNFTALQQPPSSQHLLGTDELGRDILSRILYGARVSLVAGLVSVSLALVLGGIIGLVAGFYGGWLDNLLMRLTDAMLAFPFLVLAIALAAVLGPSLQNTLLAIGIVTTPVFARLVRGQTLAERPREYVQAALALGVGDGRMLLRHLLPNILGPLIVQVSLSTAAAVLAEATLSFLGLGIQPPTPSWGSMLNAARGYLAYAPWMAIFPGLAIFLAVLAFNLIGDGLRDALDPRLKR